MLLEIRKKTVSPDSLFRRIPVYDGSLMKP